jgi:transposase
VRASTTNPRCPSERRTTSEKTNAIRNQVHPRAANLRADALHELTTAVTVEYSTVVVEDLNVTGMLNNRRLGRVRAVAAPRFAGAELPLEPSALLRISDV